MAIDYNAQAEARLSRMDELFRRAEAFQFEMAKLQEAYGDINIDDIINSMDLGIQL